jgi:two-component system, LuxR family, sensor kinase FixL
MNPLPAFVAYSETNRTRLWAIAAVLMSAIFLVDWKLLPDISIGFLYIVPILLVAGSLNALEIVVLSALCGVLREMYNPANVQPGGPARILVGFGGFALAGLFVSELHEKRRLVTRHLREREQQIKLRLDAEQQVRVLIETSPLAILIVNQEGKIQLVNQSAHQLLGFEAGPLQGADIRPFLPILERLLKGQKASPGLRTTVECKGTRRDGEVFLAHMWVSTYQTLAGMALAAVVWDASENLRDREGAGLDSMMATSRVLIGAVSHEIRNLAAAALTAHEGLASNPGLRAAEHFQALGTIIKGLEKIASSGLRMASRRTAVVADIGAVLDEARIVIEPSVREAGGSVVWRVAGGLPLVQADHHSLLQVFLNLARNSERAIRDAGQKHIMVEAGLERDLVMVRVRDTGPGIANPDQLFRPFQPGAQSDGLGLYISRAILRSEGGDLRYEARQSGACFVVELWPAENDTANDG